MVNIIASEAATTSQAAITAGAAITVTSQAPITADDARTGYKKYSLMTVSTTSGVSGHSSDSIVRTRFFPTIYPAFA